MLAITDGEVDGAQGRLLPPPPMPSFVPTDQAPRIHDAPRAHNPSNPATRKLPVSRVLPRATNNGALPSFKIRPQINRGPTRVVADRSASLSTATGQQSGVADSVGSNSYAVPGTPTDDGPRGDIWTAETNSTAMRNIPQQSLARLRVPLEIQRRARKMLKTGKRLAERGALYSARQEFLGVLQLIAQSYDAQLGKRFHTRALANGLRALREAGDFVTHRTDYDIDLQLEGLVAGHQTAVLKNTSIEDLTPFVAMQRYYEYASDQLALAGNREPTASEALYAMGRAETAMAAKSQSKLSGPKPLAFYQAALVVDQSNSAASNELGVLLARAGKLEQATNVLQHALTIRPTPELVKNLTAVNRRLNGGEALPPLDVAPNQTTPEMLAQRLQVQWMSPEEYSGTIGPPAPMMNNNANMSRQVNPLNLLPAPHQQRFPLMTR